MWTLPRRRCCARFAARPWPGWPDADCAAVYPPAGSRKEYNFVKRLLLLLSVVGAAVCIVVNLLVMPSFWWWTIVVTALVYAWAVVPHAMRRGGNAAGKCSCRWWRAARWPCLWTLKQATGAGAFRRGARVHLRGHRGGGGAGDVQPHQLGGVCAVSGGAGGVWLAMPVLYFTGLAHSLVGAVVPSILGGGHIGRHGRVRRPDDQKRIPPAAAFLTMGSLLRQPPP